MSMKRTMMFLLIACGAPYWLFLRARFGGQFAFWLATAWGIELGGFWLVGEGYIPDVPTIWIYWCREMFVIYLLLSWIWVGQLVWWVIYEGESLLQRQGGSRPLYAGVFWFASKPSPFFDIIRTFFAMTLLAGLFMSVPPALRDLSAFIWMSSAGCFLLGAMICHANGNMLPTLRARRRPKQAKTKRYIAKSHASAKRSNEGLAHIFSRRDKALRELTGS